MSTWPVPSALQSGTQMFPTLTEAQIARAQPYGTMRKAEQGDILFRPGDTSIPFFILISGKLDILQPTFDGERLVTTHGPGAFTGELNMISRQPSLVLGRVSEPGEFLELTPDGMRMLIARDAELSEILMRAFILRRLELVNQKLGDVILLGSRHSADTLRLREFLGRNSHPHVFVDLDTDTASQQLLDRFNVAVADIPVVFCSGGAVLRNPSTPELADCLGLNASVDRSTAKDVIIVGAGPAGLAAAVYAASEGLETLLIEIEAPGGQAGSSSKIENYLGFPMGVSGQELASRAIHQAQKFGAQMIIARKIVRLRCEKHPYQVLLDDGTTITTRAIVIATGAQYNRPNIPDLDKFEGQGVYYGATYVESQLCEGEDVVVVGGGNSAGQAAVFLAQTARRVHMLVRSGGLSDTMSRYLIHRISEHPGIELHVRTEIVGMYGDGRLERIEWKNKPSGETAMRDIRHVFMMAGASPRTEWLRGCLVLDDKGFVVTGTDLATVGAQQGAASWPLARHPLLLETSLPGVFAVGDVRSGSVKRVASAVGEGAIAVHLVHRTLAEL
jgi:thioredoxin reductase (NADPH)